MVCNLIIIKIAGKSLGLLYSMTVEHAFLGSRHTTGSCYYFVARYQVLYL